MSISPRENLLSLFNRDGYESAPVQFSLCPSQVEEYKRRIGSDMPYTDYFDFPWRHVALKSEPVQREIDWSRYFDEKLAEGTCFSQWGVAHEPGGKASMHMTRMRHPMKRFDSLEQFQAYPYPDYSSMHVDEMKTEVEEIKNRGYASSGSYACSIWETAWYMRGMEELMMDMMTNEELATYHFDRITEQACRIVSAYAASGIDHLHLGDDIGMQKSIMMSEDMYREWLKPRLKKVIETAKDVKPDLIVSYHSCGYVAPFIPDLIECGVDVLNPVQPECMDFADIHADFGDRLSFWGTIGTQTTMPFGTPDDVRKEVRRNLEIAGAKGGLLCAPTHLVEPEVPWENIVAYVEACREL